MNPSKVQGHRLVGVAAMTVLAATLGAFGTDLYAQNLSPEGRWKTISDKTGRVRSIVKIWIENGNLSGKIEELIRKPGQNPNPICRKCQGERKNQAIKGMTFLWGFTQDGDEWNGGYILEPGSGKTYKSIVKVADDGRKLHVRGYVLIPLFGRTQVWHRVE